MAPQVDPPPVRHHLDQALAAGWRRYAHVRTAKFQSLAPAGAFALNEQALALQAHCLAIGRVPGVDQKRRPDGHQFKPANPSTSVAPIIQNPTPMVNDTALRPAYSKANWRGVTLQLRRRCQASA